MRLKDIMNKNPHTLSEEDSILDASKFMEKEKIRNLPVVNKNNQLVGLITLREIIDGWSQDPRKIKVKDAMIKQVTAVEPTLPVKGAIEMLILNKYSCLPIVDDQKTLLGFVTEFDLLKILYDFEKKSDKELG